MHGIPFAEPAVFFRFHPVGMCFLILCGIIVTVLALSAGQRDPCTHRFTSENIKKSHYKERLTAPAY